MLPTHTELTAAALCHARDGIAFVVSLVAGGAVVTGSLGASSCRRAVTPATYAGLVRAMDSLALQLTDYRDYCERESA